MTAKHSDGQKVSGAAREPMSKRTSRPRNWCSDCGEEAGMMPAEKAATICQCSRRRIYRWIEEGDLHFTEMPDGDVMIRGQSLARKMEELDTATGKLSPRKLMAT